MNNERDPITGRILPKVTPEVLARICELYAENPSSYAVGAALGLTSGAVCRALKRAGVKRNRHHRLSPEEVERILADWKAGDETDAIATRYDISSSTVQRVTNRHLAGFRKVGQKRIYALNEAAFDELTPESLYWLGVMATDGHVGRAKKGQHTRHVTLSLQERDIALVEAFRDFLGSTHPIKLRDYHKKRSESHQRMCVLTVASGRLADRLESLGLVPNKAELGLTVPPEVAQSSAFWRGCIDGDGTVKIQSGRPTIALYGSRQLLAQFAEFMGAHLGKVPTVHNGGHKDCKTCQVRIDSRGAESLAAILYDGATVALRRKAEAAASFKDRRMALDTQAEADRIKRETATCSAPECGRKIGKSGARGLCPSHYGRVRYAEKKQN